MSEILFEFRSDDAEVREALEQAFAGQLETLEIDRFEGAMELMQIVVPITSATIGALTTILVSYFKTRADERTHRSVQIPNRKLRIEGYSAEDVEKISPRGTRRQIGNPVQPPVENYLQRFRTSRPCAPTATHTRIRAVLSADPSLSGLIFEPIDTAQAEPCLLRRGGSQFLLWDENYARWQRDVLSTLMLTPQHRAEIGCDAIIFARVAELLTAAGHADRGYVALWRRNQVLSQQQQDQTPPQPGRLAPAFLDYMFGLQDLFLFYHELAHIAFRSDAERGRVYRQTAAEMIESEIAMPVNRPVMRADVERWMGMHKCSEREAEAHAREVRRGLIRAFGALRSDAAATEELSCDLYAIDKFFETGFDPADANARVCLYSAILMHGQIQASFNSIRLRCDSPEAPIHGLVDEIARGTMARMQARMMRLMGHFQPLAPAGAEDLDAVVPFRALYNQMQALFDEIFVPRLYSILFEDEFAGKPIREGAQETYVRYGVFGRLDDLDIRIPLGSGPLGAYAKRLSGRDLHRLVFAGLGWTRLNPDEQLEIEVQV